MKLLHILHLEDDPFDAELTLATLQDEGLNCRCTRVDNRVAFEKALETNGIDIILADYSLPGFDGGSALEIARSLRPDIPFIFVSGALGEELAIEMLKSGATDYILKQRLTRLVPAITRALRETQERTERERAQRSLRFLVEAGTKLTTSLDYETSLATLADLVVPLLADMCVLQIFDVEGELQTVAVRHIEHEREITLRDYTREHAIDLTRDTDVVRSIQSGEPLLIEDINETWLEQFKRSEENMAQMRAVNLCSMMNVPLLARGRTLGTLLLGTLNQPDGRRFDSQDLTLAQNLTNRAALAIDNARLYRETQLALRARDEFLATLSHELRTPLNAMLGWTQLLRTGSLDGSMTKQALEIVERNTKSQAQLIEELLDVSRIITGKLRLNVTAVPLDEVVEGALESVKLAAEAKNISIEFTHESPHCVVSGDAHRLQQVVWNLLSNALKFTAQGGRVQVLLDSEENNARITVSDTGEGIAPDFLPHVFERFRQADSSSTRSHGGLGLGLGIVRHLVELHGGTVKAQSDGKGQGATFTVLLPLLNSSTADIDTRPPVRSAINDLSTEPPVADLRGLRILIVDDQSDARRLVAATLECCGATVQTAGSCEEAMRQFEAAALDGGFSVLVSDIGMPGESGYELLQRIRAQGAENHGDVPAMALTAYARESDRERAYKSGFQAYAVKPIEPARLVQLVADLASK